MKLLKTSLIFVVLTCIAGCTQVLRKDNVLEASKNILAVEVGAKGVKGRVFNASRNEKGEYSIRELSNRKDINTDIVDAKSEITEQLDDAKITKTANAVSDVVDYLKKDNKIFDNNVYIFGSSALEKYKNKDNLSSKVNNIIDKQIEYIDVNEEVFYGYINSVPNNYQNTALIIDIGSGNTKLGFYDQLTKRANHIDVPLGTKTFLEKIITKRCKFVITPGDIKNPDQLLALIKGYKYKDEVIESVVESLSSESHMNMLGDKSENAKELLLQSVVRDLNSIILTDKTFAEKFVKKDVDKDNKNEFYHNNRLILESIFPINKHSDNCNLSNESLVQFSKLFIGNEIADKVSYNKELRSRNPVFLIGGVVWALTTLMHPDKSDEEVVNFSYEDIVEFSKKPVDEIAKITSIDNLTGKKLGLNAPKELIKVRQTFKPEELSAGVMILKSVVEEMHLTDQKLSFVRNGSWQKGAVLYKMDKTAFMFNEKGSSKNQNMMVTDTDEGVFENEGKIYVKARNRSFLSVLDELAYKLRFNYTVLKDYTGHFLNIFEESDKISDPTYISINWSKIKSMKFNSIDGFLNFISNNKNSSVSSLSDIDFKKNSDGFLFGVTKPDTANDYQNTYKKVFLNSITSREAEEAIKKLYFAKETEIKFENNKYKSINIAPQAKAGQASGQVMQSSPDTTQLAFSTFSSVNPPEISNPAVVNVPAQNALIIKANRDLLQVIGDTIASLDVRYPQVLVETTVFEVDDSISKKIGAVIDFSKSNGGGTFNIKTPLQEGLSLTTLPALFSSYTDPEKKLSILTNLALNDRDGKVKVLAEPRIVMKPGEEAAIALNTVKYVAVQGVNAADLKDVETGITFKITPIILSENKISLKLSIEQSEFIPTSENNITLSTNKNTINTTIVANDGELVSIGGINTKRYTGFTSGIPFLKDIPFLGVLFSTRTKDSANTKIEFMIKPVIKNMNSYQKHKSNYIEEEKLEIDNDIKIRN